MNAHGKVDVEFEQSEGSSSKTHIGTLTVLETDECGFELEDLSTRARSRWLCRPVATSASHQLTNVTIDFKDLLCNSLADGRTLRLRIRPLATDDWPRLTALGDRLIAAIGNIQPGASTHVTSHTSPAPLHPSLSSLGLSSGKLGAVGRAGASSPSMLGLQYAATASSTKSLTQYGKSQAQKMSSGGVKPYRSLGFSPSTATGGNGSGGIFASMLSRAAVRPPTTQLRGFSNFGNTCYMNAVLIALLHTPPFVCALLDRSIEHCVAFHNTRKRMDAADRMAQRERVHAHQATGSATGSATTGSGSAGAGTGASGGAGVTLHTVVDDDDDEDITFVGSSGGLPPSTTTTAPAAIAKLPPGASCFPPSLVLARQVASLLPHDITLPPDCSQPPTPLVHAIGAILLHPHPLVSTPAALAGWVWRRLCTGTLQPYAAPLTSTSTTLLYKQLLVLAKFKARGTDVDVEQLQKFKRFVSNYDATFAGNEQQDAHELLANVLSKLEEESSPFAADVAAINGLYAADGVDVARAAQLGDTVVKDFAAAVAANATYELPDASSNSVSGGGSGVSVREQLEEAAQLHAQAAYTELRTTIAERTSNLVVRATITCCNPACAYVRHTIESYQSISVDLPPGDEDSNGPPPPPRTRGSSGKASSGKAFKPPARVTTTSAAAREATSSSSGKVAPPVSGQKRRAHPSLPADSGSVAVVGSVDVSSGEVAGCIDLQASDSDSDFDCNSFSGVKSEAIAVAARGGRGNGWVPLQPQHGQALTAPIPTGAGLLLEGEAAVEVDDDDDDDDVVRPGYSRPSKRSKVHESEAVEMVELDGTSDAPMLDESHAALSPRAATDDVDVDTGHTATPTTTSRSPPGSHFDLSTIFDYANLNEPGYLPYGSKPSAYEMPPKVYTLAGLLRYFLRPILVNLNCGECAHGEASISYEIISIPRVLILHLKRFEFTADGECRKRLDFVKFEPQLDLSCVCADVVRLPPPLDLRPSPAVDKEIAVAASAHGTPSSTAPSTLLHSPPLKVSGGSGGDPASARTPQPQLRSDGNGNYQVNHDGSGSGGGIGTSFAVPRRVATPALSSERAINGGNYRESIDGGRSSGYAHGTSGGSSVDRSTLTGHRSESYDLAALTSTSYQPQLPSAYPFYPPAGAKKHVKTVEVAAATLPPGVAAAILENARYGGSGGGVRPVWGDERGPSEQHPYGSRHSTTGTAGGAARVSASSRLIDHARSLEHVAKATAGQRGNTLEVAPVGGSNAAGSSHHTGRPTSGGNSRIGITSTLGSGSKGAQPGRYSDVRRSGGYTATRRVGSGSTCESSSGGGGFGVQGEGDADDGYDCTGIQVVGWGDSGPSVAGNRPVVLGIREERDAPLTCHLHADPRTITTSRHAATSLSSSSACGYQVAATAEDSDSGVDTTSGTSHHVSSSSCFDAEYNALSTSLRTLAFAHISDSHNGGRAKLLGSGKSGKRLKKVSTATTSAHSEVESIEGGSDVEPCGRCGSTEIAISGKCMLCSSKGAARQGTAKGMSVRALPDAEIRPAPKHANSIPERFMKDAQGDVGLARALYMSALDAAALPQHTTPTPSAHAAAATRGYHSPSGAVSESSPASGTDEESETGGIDGGDMVGGIHMRYEDLSASGSPDAATHKQRSVLSPAHNNISSAQHDGTTGNHTEGVTGIGSAPLPSIGYEEFDLTTDVEELGGTNSDTVDIDFEMDGAMRAPSAAFDDSPTIVHPATGTGTGHTSEDEDVMYMEEGTTVPTEPEKRMLYYEYARCREVSAAWKVVEERFPHSHDPRNVGNIGRLRHASHPNASGDGDGGDGDGVDSSVIDTGDIAGVPRIRAPWESRVTPPTIAKYRLQTIIRHEGRRAFRGHYTTDVHGEFTRDIIISTPTQAQDVWYRYDDRSVFTKQHTEVFGPDGQRQAYMLVYTLAA